MNDIVHLQYNGNIDIAINIKYWYFPMLLLILLS